MTCPTCGATVAEGARFCSSCGHPLASRGDERRIATVLFADLVGFTSLSELRDPEEVKNLVDSCFERLVQDVNAFGGKVDKIIGDAILALFGAPIAHEDDAERAVRAALRMQETLSTYCADSGADIQLRIGVNTGEVLVGSLRAGAEYTAMGDVVNTAQRLQSSARPGSVVVGPATFAATRDVIDYRSLGSIAAKGREEPVDTWEAVATLLPPGYRPTRTLTPFVGREAELGILTNAVDTAISRSRAHLVLLLGEAGVGKSRLAAEVAQRACSTHHAHVYEGRCVPYGEANVWWPVAEALRQACAIAPEDVSSVAQELTTEAVAAALEQPADAAEVRRVVNGLLHLMGYESPLNEIDAQRAREEAHRSVLTFIEGSARQRPVVVVLSDLHWADDIVLEMIDALADRLSRSRFVLVATARHALNERWRMPTGRHNNVLVNLDPLDREATSVLLEALAESEVEADLREALLDRSGGNPFFLEELVALVAEVDGAGVENGRDDDHGLRVLPDTLRGLVAARIDGLTPEERGSLEDAAVWGRSGPIEALERMAEEVRSLPDLAPVLAGLVDKEILVVSGKRWSFRSDLIREVAYGTMTKADRARRHYGIASYLERHMVDRDDLHLRAVDVIAHHYASAAELAREIGTVDWVPATINEQALDWLEQAARRAELSQMSPVADRLYAQALELVDKGDDARTARLLIGRARAEAALRELTHARTMIESASELAERSGEGAILAEAKLALGDIHQKAGELDEAVATFDDALERFDHLGDRAGMAESLRQRGMTNIFRGANDLAEKSISEALELFAALGDRRGEAWALQNLAWISYVEGRADEAERRLDESATLFEQIGDGGGLAWARGLLGFVRYHQGRFDDAERLAVEVMADSRERGDKWGLGMMLMLTAAVRLWSGRAEAAIAPAEESLGMFRSIADPFGESQAIGMLGRALITSGRVADGLQVLQQGVEAFGATGQDERQAAVAAMLLLSATQLGDVGRAREVLELVPDDHNSGLGTVEMVVGRALFEIQQGAPARAVGPLQALVEGNGGRSGFAHSALAFALATTGRHDEAVRMAGTVDELTGTTYLDRTAAELAVLLGRAAAGDETSVEGFTDLVAAIDETQDRCSQAVVRLAEGLALEAMGLPTAEWALSEVERRLDELEIDASGWRTAFALALAADKAPAGA